MKKEVYSCLKMMESFHSRVINTYNIKEWDSANELGKEYERIYDILSKYLDKSQLEFIQNVKYEYASGEYLQKIYMLKLSTASKIALSFLESLEMDLDKELVLKKEEFDRKERELEYSQKLLKKSLEAIKQIPELQRSKIVEEIKKSHREIEKHTKEKKAPKFI